MKILPLALLVLAAGCSEKSSPPPAPPAQGAKSSEYRAPALKALTYKTPPEWVSEPVEGNKMRKAQYRIPDKNGKDGPALLTFYDMAPQETETIVNYWRQKMGGADAAVSKIQGAQNPTTLVDIAGSYDPGDGPAIDNARFLGAMIDVGQLTWYLKFAGPEATVSGWKDAFVEMLKGLRAVQ